MNDKPARKAARAARAKSKLTDDDLKALADQITWRALLMMEESGVSFQMMMDRLLTAAGAHIVAHEGAEHTAKVFRTLADNVDAGCFDTIEARHSATSH